jgi:hypothetical protein
VLNIAVLFIRIVAIATYFGYFLVFHFYVNSVSVTLISEYVLLQPFNLIIDRFDDSALDIIRSSLEESQ